MTITRHEQTEIYSKAAEANGFVFTAGIVPADLSRDVKGQTEEVLREIDRLSEDLSQEELDRAKVGITAKQQTHGDITRARVSEMSTDLFLFGRPVPQEEKLARVHAVTIADIKRYLNEHPRDRLCTVTLGPKPLDGAAS